MYTYYITNLLIKFARVWRKNSFFRIFCKIGGKNMNSSNLVLIALLFLLVNNNTISTTQLLLLLALLSTTTGCLNNLFNNNNCCCNGNLNQTTNWNTYKIKKAGLSPAFLVKLYLLCDTWNCGRSVVRER